MRSAQVLSFALLLAFTGCTDRPLRPDEKILGIAETESWQISGLVRPVYVVRTEANIPHIYAYNRRDLALVEGFVMARDRYFMMDLARRLGTGTISELLGQDALANDQESRGSGMAHVAAQIDQGFSPELGEYAAAFAEGVNEYIRRVQSGELPPPSELEFASTLLFDDEPHALMKPFDRASVAAMVAVILYNSSYETGDVGRSATAAALPALFEGAAYQDLRRAGAIEDLWQAIEPARAFVSAPGMGTVEGYDGPAGTAAGATMQQRAGNANMAPPAFAISSQLLSRASGRNAHIAARLRRDRDGFGSNAWAVAGYASSDGAGLLAGDGHLSLAVPSILYHIGLDTSVFGREAMQQLGLTIPGFPVMAIGTNGRVAWSQTQLFGDITDWYAEQIQLEGGKPARSLFNGQWQPLTAVEESYVIADVPVLDSPGRTETWTRWVTFDGRFLADVEGREAAPGDPLAPGEALVNMRGSYVVPGDVDDDGIVTAISYDYAGFDAGHILSAPDALGHAADVYDFREKMRGLVGYSQNFTVADNQGNILYSAYQAVPCRAYLDRESDGRWAPGADPSQLLDGTRYGAFTIPVMNGVVDESQTDPSTCVVPFDGIPMSINPAIGHVVTANNDPGGMSLDRSLTNDAHYIGGPWLSGFRALTIATELERAIAEGSANVDKMAEIQGNAVSPLGQYLLDDMLASIAYARALPSAPTDPADQRIRALYQGEAGAIDEVEARLTGWRDRGHQARSGVETFYAAPTPDDREDAVATMVFNAWMSRVVSGTFDDEMLPGVFQPSGTHGKVKGLHQFLRGRGAGNPSGLSSYNADTQESVFFDVLSTPEVETSHEIIVAALVDALAFLRSAPSEEDPASGGFGTSDMAQWLWGLRHYVRFQSLLDDFLGAESDYSALTAQFAITTATLPLFPGLAPNDPRGDLEWFPRDGDQYGVDAGNPGISGTQFHYGDGPVMRMVVALKGDQVWGKNIIPGGQSAITGSPFFADQAKLWLANETLPLRYSVDQVVEGAAGRESYVPH